MSKISRQISFFDLTGGINNVDTMERFNSSPKKTESPDMINVEYYKLGGIKSMEGNTQIGDKQDSPVVGGWEYTKQGIRYMVIALRDGELKVYNQSEREFDKVYKFPNQSDRVSFCNMNNGVIATNGIDDPVFYEYGRKENVSGSVDTVAESDTVVGSSTSFTVQLQVGDKIEIDSHNYVITSITDDTHLTIARWFTESSGTGAVTTSTGETLYLKEISQCNANLTNTDPELVPTPEPIPIRGNAIQFYAGRLWIGGDKGLFYSGVGEYNHWDIYTNDAGMIGEVYNDSSEVQALGLYSDYMLVHKRYNTYLLTMNGDSETISIKPYSNISCNSQQSWVVSNTKYYVYSREHMDIFPLSQRTIYSDRYLGEAITNKVRNLFQNLNDNETKNIFCATLPRKRWMMFYLPMITGLGSNYVLIFDFQTKSFIARQLPQSQRVTIAFNYNGNVYVGTYDGRVLKEFTGSTFGEIVSIDGAVTKGENINAYYKSPWFDWANNYTHSFSEYIICLSPDLNNNFKIRTFKDGDSNYEERVINDQEMVNTGLEWDGGKYESNYDITIRTFPTTYYEYTANDTAYYCLENEVAEGNIVFNCSNNIALPIGVIEKVNVGTEESPEYAYQIEIDGVGYEIEKVTPEQTLNIYDVVYSIPDIRSDASEDTVYNIDEDVYITLLRDGDDLVINKYTLPITEEEEYTTISNFFENYEDPLHYENNNTMWDKDVWTAGRFTSIRMLLPNNVFEQFQVEIYIDGEDNQGFAIDGYAFRRIETDEAPW